MERILILMQAANWAEATEALTSARENALHRNALSYALVLPEAPTSPEECNMAAFGALQYLISPEMTFAAMKRSGTANAMRCWRIRRCALSATGRRSSCAH